MAEEAFQAFVREQRAQRPPGAEEPDWEEEWDDLTLAQKELRKREPKKYTGGDGSEIEEEEEEEVKPARKRGRPSKAGITGSASKAFLKHKAPAVPKAFDLPVTQETLQLFREELEKLPDDAVLHGLSDLVDEEPKTEAPPAAADADSSAPAAAEACTSAAPAPVVHSPGPPIALAPAVSTLTTPRDAVGNLLAVFYFLQSYRELLLPEHKDLEHPSSLTGLLLVDLDQAVGDPDSLVLHDLHCMLLVFLARASKEVRAHPGDYEVDGASLDDFTTLSAPPAQKPPPAPPPPRVPWRRPGLRPLLRTPERSVRSVAPALVGRPWAAPRETL